MWFCRYKCRTVNSRILFRYCILCSQCNAVICDADELRIANSNVVVASPEVWSKVDLVKKIRAKVGAVDSGFP